MVQEEQAPDRREALLGILALDHQEAKDTLPHQGLRSKADLLNTPDQKEEAVLLLHLVVHPQEVLQVQAAEVLPVDQVDHQEVEDN